MEDSPSTPTRVGVLTPWRTIIKLCAATLLAYIVVRLWRFEELLILALLIAVAFRPLVQWMAKHHWPKWLRVLVPGLILLGLTALVFGILIPTISDQGTTFVKKLPELKDKLSSQLPASGPLRNMADPVLNQSAFSNPEPILKKLFAWGSLALQRVAEYFVMLILAIYFLADGERLYRWLVAFLPECQRRKVGGAADEATSVVTHYVAGNLFTSLLAAGYAFAVLRILHVPNAALLAVLAGVFDLLPMIGIFLFIIPATLMALTVSPKTALIVAALYGVYHLVENYFIVPKVYGNRLRLSDFAVLVACLTAGMVSGVIGVIIVLPIIACYPIVERTWLGRWLPPDTVKLHEQLDCAS